MAKACRFCGSFAHTGFTCRNRPFKPLARKRIRRRGKISYKWEEVRKEWIEEDGRSAWTCYLQISPLCVKELTIETLTLDHVVSRTHDPSRRFDKTNLRPACGPCNEQKGSRDIEDL